MDGTVPTVFVIDDDSTVRNALARLIRSHGMQVVTFASAREFLRCQDPDGTACLILDVRLAGENGLRRVAGKFVRKYTLRHYQFFFKEIQAKSAGFSTPS